MEKLSCNALIFNPKYLSISHQYCECKSKSKSSKNQQIIKDDSEQKLIEFISDTKKFNLNSKFDHKGMMKFLFSKFEAMKKLELNDEIIEDTNGNDKIEIRKIDIDKKLFPKSQEKNLYKEHKSNKTIQIKKIEKCDHEKLIEKFIEKESKKSLKNFISKNFHHHHEKRDSHENKKKDDLPENIETITNISNIKSIDPKEGSFPNFFSNKELLYSVLMEMDKSFCK